MNTSQENPDKDWLSVNTSQENRDKDYLPVNMSPEKPGSEQADRK